MPKYKRLTPEQLRENELAYSREYNNRPETKEYRKQWSKTEAGRASDAAAQERYRAKKQGRESKAPPVKVSQTEEERRESNRLASLAQYRKNKSVILQRKKAWRDANPELQKTLQEEWRKAHPDRVYANSIKSLHRRRVLLEGQPDIDIDAWKVTLELFEHKCVYCRAEATCIDHVVPVSRGGTNHITNLIQACKRCNSSKGNKSLGDWLQSSRIAKEALSRPWDWQPPQEECQAAQ